MMKIQVYLYHVFFFLSECSKWSLININYNFKRVSITKSAYYYFLTFENINLLDNLAYIISRTLRYSFHLLIAGNKTWWNTDTYISIRYKLFFSCFICPVH